MRFPRLALPSLLFAGQVSLLPAAQVYYANQPENLAGVINAAALDGSSHTTLYTAPTVSDLRGIAADPAAGVLYFAYAEFNDLLERVNVSVRKINVGGGVPVTVTSLPNETSLADVEWDADNGWVYFAQPGTLELRRCKPDGSQLSTVLTHIAAGRAPYFFGLDVPGGYAYWGVTSVPDETGTSYSRGTLAGVVDPDFTLVTPSRTRDIAVDATYPGRRLFWNDRQNGSTYWRPLEGGIVQTARSGMNAPHGLALDLEAGKGYVADTGKRGNGSQLSSHRVVRFNLDGTGAAEFLSPASTVAEPWDLTLDLTSRSYADWKTRFFAATAVNSAPGDDADGDGQTNAGEYTFFTHPLRNDATNAAVQAVPGGIKYVRRRVTDVAVRVEVAADLVAWHWNGDSPGSVWTVETAVTPRDPDSEWVTVQPVNPSAASRLLFRLRAIGP